MKLYVWNNPYDVSYGGSCLYAVANSEPEAREVARSAKIIKYGINLDDDGTLGQIALGAPDRVLDLPCAEVYEWSE